MSHGVTFESDECGALKDWLQLAPQAEPICELVGKLVSVDMPMRGMTTEVGLYTGKILLPFLSFAALSARMGCQCRGNPQDVVLF
jgi:hypothetical protein